MEFAFALDEDTGGNSAPLDALFSSYTLVQDASTLASAEAALSDSGLSDTGIAGAGGSFMSLGEGADSYVAGGGWDQISFALEDGGSGVRVDLDAGSARDTYGNSETITGSFEAVRGSGRDDQFYGDGGDNTFWGLAGDDYMNGRGGADTARYDRDARYGGTGGVTVDLSAGTATDGFGDSDRLVDIENVRGSDANDTITGDSGDNTIAAEGGDDVLHGTTGNDRLYGGDGVDWVRYASFTDAIQVYLNAGKGKGAQGYERYFEIENVEGGSGNDFIVGTTGDNVLTGGDGNDVIRGKGGMDTYHGGNGNDRLRGDEQVDTIYGQADDDTLLGLSGDDLLDGGDGADRIYGGRDNDTMNGGADEDILRGNKGDDTMNGGDGADDLRGGGGNDVMNGDADNDYLVGQNGEDRLSGGAGDDTYVGGLGGGNFDGKSDIFVFESSASGGGGADKIKDFENGLDLIDLTAFGFSDFTTEIAVLASASGSALILDFGGGDTLQIDSFALSDFDASDVILS